MEKKSFFVLIVAGIIALLGFNYLKNKKTKVSPPFGLGFAQDSYDNLELADVVSFFKKVAESSDISKYQCLLIDLLNKQMDLSFLDKYPIDIKSYASGNLYLQCFFNAKDEDIDINLSRIILANTTSDDLLSMFNGKSLIKFT